MKKVLIAVLVMISALNGHAQHFAIANNKQNIVYVGLDNPLTVSVEKYSCKSIVLQTKDGTLTKDEDCNYSLRVTEPGTAIVEVGVKENGKVRVVGQMPFRAKSIPDPIVRIGGHIGGVVPKNQFLVQLGMTAGFEGLDICGNFKVIEFYMTVVRLDKVIFGHKNSGPMFDDTFNYFKSELTRGDRVVFSNIHCVGPDGKDRHVAPMEFVLE